MSWICANGYRYASMLQAIANQGMTHGSSIGSKHPGTMLNGISEEGQDTSTYQSESCSQACIERITSLPAVSQSLCL